MKYKTFSLGVVPPDLLIEDDITWIRVEDKPSAWSGLWPGVAYQRLDVVRAKDYDPARGTHDYPSGRYSRSGGEYFDRTTGSYHSFVDESGEYEPKSSAPLIPEYLWQASLYGRLSCEKDD